MHALGVLQMTRIVIGDADRQWMPRGAGRQFDQDFRNIATFGGQSIRPVRIRRIITQQVSVFLHSRPTPGGVDRDHIHVGRLKCVDRAAGKGNRQRLLAGMRHEGAAATLTGRDDHVASIGRQNAGGCLIDVVKENALDATEQEANAQIGTS